MAVAEIFNYRGLSQAEIERAENRRALQRTPTEQFRFLTDLIELSASLRNDALEKSPPTINNLYKSVHDFFQKLNEYGVQYLLIGGFAVNAYGHAETRATSTFG